MRPATDALRQALFSSLAARVAGARFLDLFAGSGAYGLEALSRGASGGLWVERDRRALACLEKNRAAVLKSAGLAHGEVAPKIARILNADVTSPSWTAAVAALVPDLIFIDPPYDEIERLVPPLFARLHALLSTRSEPFGERPAPLVILECPGGLAPAPQGWECLKRLGAKHPHQPSLALFTLAP